MNSLKRTKPYLNPNQMAFRKPYAELVLDGKLTTVFRPGHRLAGDERGYRPNQMVMARIIDRPGLDWACIEPAFVPEVTRCLRIDQVYVKAVADLELSDFVGSSPDIHDQQSLLYHLGVVYNLSPNEIEEVTVIKFSFMSRRVCDADHPCLSVSDLVRSGLARLASQPKDNPDHLSTARRYSVSFIEHDYPARTPAMWNAVYRKFDLSDVAHMMYVADVADTRAILVALKADPTYLGGGMGVGFKDEVVAHLDTVDPVARKIGAVNIVVKSADDTLFGYNTDGEGYAASLEERFRQSGQEMSGTKAVILGAGGTANAIAFALAARGMRVVVLNRTVEKAELLASRVNLQFGLIGDKACRFGGENDVPTEVLDAAVVVNASTKGAVGPLESYIALAPAELMANGGAIDINRVEAQKILRAIPHSTIISDVVLRAGDTPLIALAKQEGYQTLDGIPMVVHQGVEALWLVHGEELAEKGVSKQDIFPVMKQAAGF